MVLHTHRQLERCVNTPMAIELTDPGWLATVGVDPAARSRAGRPCVARVLALGKVQ